MKKKILLGILLLAYVLVGLAYGGNVNVVNPVSKPVPVTNVGLSGAAAVVPYAAHITTSATTTVTSSTAYVNALVVTTTNAGTTWALKIQNKEGTPKVLYNITAVAVGTVVIPLDGALLMTGGIDIITTGATPGVLDVFLNYAQ